MFLRFIRENAMRLTKLMDDLVAHAQLSHQATPLQKLDALETVQAVLEEHQLQVGESTVEVRLDLQPARILGDRLCFTQALGNLLENAVKYSASSKAPVISVGGRVQGETYCLWVKDNGIGFDMAYHDKIFEIFQRLHSRVEFPGTGVGLALVKRAVEKMGGKVWAESALNQGASFYLELRMAN